MRSTPPRRHRPGRGAHVAAVIAVALGCVVAGVTPSGATSPDSGKPQSTTTVATASDCGGQPVVRVGNTSWGCTFDDEFSAATGDATALDRSKWVPQVSATSGYTTGSGTGVACYMDSPNNISVAGGYLSLTVRREPSPFSCGSTSATVPTQYTAGMVSTYGKFSLTYGRYVVRAKIPATSIPGLQETLWLWPNNDTMYGSWPASGEIDFSEFYSNHGGLDIPYVHYNSTTTSTSLANPVNQVTAYNCPITVGAFNTYRLDWQPGQLSIQVNNKTCLVDDYVPDGGLSSPAPFDQPFFLALTQALGTGADALVPTTPLPATTQIDYVRVWGPIK